MSKTDGNGSETHTVRLSFRATQRGYEKLVMIAKVRGWINARGHPNVSRVLNYLIDQFDASVEIRKFKRERKRRGQRTR